MDPFKNEGTKREYVSTPTKVNTERPANRKQRRALAAVKRKQAKKVKP